MEGDDKTPSNQQHKETAGSDRADQYHANQRARAAQWRCHPRLADFVAANLEWYSVKERWRRLQLLYACAVSEPGKEPQDPFLTDPRKHRIDKQK